jgi:hypothetical protein
MIGREITGGFCRDYKKGNRPPKIAMRTAAMAIARGHVRRRVRTEQRLAERIVAEAREEARFRRCGFLS